MPLLVLLASIASPSVRACQEINFEPLDGGRQLRDPSTGLIWQRCVIGQNWDGVQCLNEDTRSPLPGKQLTYREAMREALWQNQRSQFGQTTWRVPSQAELLSLKNAACQTSNSEYFFSAKQFPTATPWPVNGALWISGPFDLKRGVQVVKVKDAQSQWVTYGDETLHQLLLVR